MTEEIRELHESAEEACRDPGLVPVTLSMAILAVVLAAISLLGRCLVWILGEVTGASGALFQVSLRCAPCQIVLMVTRLPRTR